MITTHPRLFRLLIVLLALLGLLCAWLFPLPLRAQGAPPSLTIFSVNDLGHVDLLPGSRVLIVAELRSDDRQTAALRVDSLPGLVLASADASAGAVAVFDMYPPSAPPPGILWTGEVSATQPINLRLLYAVPPATPAGDLTIRVSGQAGNMPLVASTMIRVCCAPAPPAQRPPGWRVYLAVIRR